ncbi:MAG: AAA family ATPase, partial [Myxococcales bacterium]|nr:AAA family ATPase [Myxococcales bacterium]
RDEAEIRGHRRTYVGALPGKILSGLTRAGCMNPLLMLDEIDKIGSDHRGDPASALLEVLDPEQNDTFTDHYFNVPFDLSKVLFIVTANYLHDIPRPLLDRLEVISIEGYTESEKLAIARDHLVPKVLHEHGLLPAAPQVGEEAVRAIVRGWTREAGVRNLQRSLEQLARKIARRQVESGDQAPVTVAAETITEFLGPPRFSHDEGVDGDQVGAANGLAWTSSGGEILVIEALKMPGKGKLIITGKLGEVMKESVQAAYSFTRSRAERLGLEPGELDTVDLHIHFPAGAVPKDGPSAGVTVTLALASLLSGRAVRADVAMTGEVTLRGKVLAVGGIKDKLLAAYRAGIAHVALPKANEKDLMEVPAEVRGAITFHPIEHVDELLALALRPLTGPPELAHEAIDDELRAPL